jgi:NCS1 family nucleobase:cation symporter-1
MLSTFASNLGANLIPWGADTSILLSRFIDIRRGMYISYIIAICICTWHILKSATIFLRFLVGYSVFVGLLVGISITDYFVIRRGNIWIADLYTSDRRGRYWYRYGLNWKAFAAYFVAVVLPIPGFSTLFGQHLGLAWLKIYDVWCLIGCILSSVTYFLLCQMGGFARVEKEMGFGEVSDIQIIEGLQEAHGPISNLKPSEVVVSGKSDLSG